MSARFGRAVFLVPDLDEALEFWVDAFECRVLADQPVPGGRYLHVGFPADPAGSGAPGLWLLGVPDGHPRSGSQTGEHPTLVLYVDDLDASLKRATGAGAHLIAGPDSDSAARYAHLTDPLGNVVVCVEAPADPHPPR